MGRKPSEIFISGNWCGCGVYGRISLAPPSVLPLEDMYGHILLSTVLSASKHHPGLHLRYGLESSPNETWPFLKAAVSYT